MAHAHVSSGGRYPVLRAVAILFLANAILVIGTGVYWIYNTLTQRALPMSDRMQVALLIAVATFFAVLITIGIAEMIKLALDIEQHTRASARSAAESASGKKWLDGEETAEGALLRGR
jgi:hypothetical protein